VAEVGRIQIEVDARQVEKATRALNDLGLKAQSTGRKVDGYEKQTEQATKATNKMANSSRKLTRMLGLLSAGIGGLTFIGLAREIGQATTQLNNIEATMRVAAGSSQAASRQLGFIREEAERLGLFFPAVAKQMAQFSAAARGTSITSKELRTIFTGISEASRAMGLTAPQAEGAMMALQQMMSKGKVSAEELRQQLGERMPGSIQIMAASLDVTTQQLFKMMENGELLSDEVLPKFGRELSKVFGREATQQADRLAASVDRLRNSFFDLLAQDQGLPGASSAINELAIVVGSSQFQKSFDTIVQSISEFMRIIADNLDHLIQLSKVLASIGIGLFAKRVATSSANLLTMAGSLNVANTSLRGYNALTAVAVASSNALAASISRIIWPLALVSGTVAAYKMFSDSSEDAEHKTANLRAEIEGLQKGFIDTSIASLEYQRSLAGPDFSEFIRQSKELAALQNELQEAQERQEDRGFFDITFGEESVATLKQQIRELKNRRSELEENTEFYAELTKKIQEQRDALQEAKDAAEDHSEVLDDARDLMEDLFPERRAFREYLDGLALVDSALEEEILTAREAAMAREELNRRFQEETAPEFGNASDEVADLERQFLTLEAPMSKIERDAKEIADAIRGDLSTSITDVIMDVESLSDAFASLARQIARTIVQQQIADPLAKSLTDFATTAIPSLFTGGPGTQSIGGGAPPTVRGIGPPAANGGNVFSNKAHLVGERGPELFVPGQDGRIIPNTEMSGAPNVNVNIINEGGEPLSVQSQSVRKSPNGETNIDLMVKSSIDRLDSQGQLDGMFRRHGGTRQGRF